MCLSEVQGRMKLCLDEHFKQVFDKVENNIVEDFKRREFDTKFVKLAEKRGMLWVIDAIKELTELVFKPGLEKITLSGVVSHAAKTAKESIVSKIANATKKTGTGSKASGVDALTSSILSAVVAQCLTKVSGEVQKLSNVLLSKLEIGLEKAVDREYDDYSADDIQADADITQLQPYSESWSERIKDHLVDVVKGYVTSVSDDSVKVAVEQIAKAMKRKYSLSANSASEKVFRNCKLHQLEYGKYDADSTNSISQEVTSVEQSPKQRVSALYIESLLEMARNHYNKESYLEFLSSGMPIDQRDAQAVSNLTGQKLVLMKSPGSTSQYDPEGISDNAQTIYVEVKSDGGFVTKPADVRYECLYLAVVGQLSLISA